MNIVEKNWNQILNKMKQEYCSSNIAYNTWVAPLTVYEVKDNTVYILVKLKASLEHIEEKYLLPFKVCIAEITGVEYEVAFVTENTAVIQEKKDIAVKNTRVNAIYEKANLNPKYTFDTFVVGSNNRYVVPISLSLGASFMILIDTLSRTISVIELPLSILTAIIGAPVFISLLNKNRSNLQ